MYTFIGIERENSKALPVKKLRNRSTIVCTNCKKRKIKCDKRQPCLRCIKSNKSDSCIYTDSNIHLLQDDSFLGPYLTNVNVSPRQIVYSENNNNNNNAKNNNSKLNGTILSFDQPMNLKNNHIETEKDDTELKNLKFQCLKLTKLVDSIDKYKDFDKHQILNSINNIVELYNSKENIVNANYNKNILLDTNLWHLTKYNKKASIENTKIFPLIYPSNLWGNSDFVDLATEVFDPLLNLFSQKWKEMKKVPRVLNDLTYNFNLNDINVILFHLKPYFFENFDAIIERINYFKSELNSIIFRNLIPEELIDNITLNLSVIENLDQIVYGHHHLEVLFILSIIEISNIFNDHLVESKFTLQMTSPFEDLNEICITLLNYTNRKQNRNLLSFLSFLMITYTTMNFSNNSFSGLSGEYFYPAFRDQIGLLFQMGYHLPEKSGDKLTEVGSFKNVAVRQDSIWKVWNYFLYIDAILSIKLGTPLMINFDYCEGFRSPFEHDKNVQLNKETLLAARQLAYILNSKKGSTYREFINIEKKISFILRKFDGFGSENDHTIRTFSLGVESQLDIKFILLNIYFFCNILLCSCLKRETLAKSVPNFDFNSSEYKEVEQIRKKCKAKAYMIYIMVMKIFILFGTENATSKHTLLCLRGDVLRWFSFPTFCMLDCLISDSQNDKFDFGSRNTNYNDILKINILDKDIQQIEVLLLDDDYLEYCCENNKIDDTQYYNLALFLIDVYESIKNNQIFSSSFDFFVKSKALCLAIYILVVFSRFEDNANNTEEGKKGGVLYNILSLLVRQRLREFQNSKIHCKSVILQQLLNHDPCDNSNDDYSNDDDLGTRLPPKEIINMIRLFMNDDRFTSAITECNLDLKQFTN